MAIDEYRYLDQDSNDQAENPNYRVAIRLTFLDQEPTTTTNLTSRIQARYSIW